jgi:hypothetical protein
VVWTILDYEYHEIHSNPMKLAFDEKEDMDVGLEGLVGKSA